MIEIDVNCQKINEYLKSFLSDGSKSTNRQDSDSLKNGSDEEVAGLQTSRLSLTNEAKSQNANPKTNTLPNNLEGFLSRLKSFENGLWTCCAISPLLCASYGWKFIKKDMLSCVTCKALICTTLPLPNKLVAYKTFSAKLKDRLRLGHKDWCEWPNRSCPPAFLHPPLRMTSHYARSLVRKVNNLLALENRLPYIKCEEILNRLGLQRKEISGFFGSQSELSQNHFIAAALVLCGWECEGQEKLKCSLCFRSIGLWSFLTLSEGSRYEQLEKISSERKERKRIIEERKRERERKLLIKEEKLKSKLLEEKKAAEAEVEAIEKALKVKQALETISKLESSDLSNPSEDPESEEEMGEEEENFLLGDDSNIELPVEEESNDASEPSCTANPSVGTNTLDEMDAEVAGSSHSPVVSTSFSNPVIENEESRSPETHNDNLYAEMEENIESDDCSKSYNENESEEDLWLEAVGGYVEGESDMSKPIFSPSSPSSSSENTIEYPDSSSNRKRQRSDSSEDNYIEEERVSSSYKRRRSESSDDNCVEEDIGSSDRKRQRSESSEDNYSEMEMTSKCRRVEEDFEPQESLHLDTNENTVTNGSNENSDSRNSNENHVVEFDNENASSVTAVEDNNTESSDEEMEEEIEEVEEDEQIIMLNKMRNSIFHPLEQHRHWCGWLVDHSSLYIDEIDTKGKGYEIIPPQISQMQPNLPDSSIVTSEKYAGNVVGLRTVRSILDSWAAEQNVNPEELE